MLFFSSCVTLAPSLPPEDVTWASVGSLSNAPSKIVFKIQFGTVYAEIRPTDIKWIYFQVTTYNWLVSWCRQDCRHTYIDIYEEVYGATASHGSQYDMRSRLS